MAEAARLMNDIDEANKRLEALRKSRRGMLGQYRKAEHAALAYIDALWSQWRACHTDTTDLPPRRAE